MQPAQAMPVQNQFAGQQEVPCQDLTMKFQQCVQMSSGNISDCQNLMDQLNQCQRDMKFSGNNY